MVYFKAKKNMCHLNKHRKGKDTFFLYFKQILHIFIKLFIKIKIVLN